MQIIVLGKTVETKEIVDIYDIERDKKMFLNGEAGFIIELADKEPLIFKQDIPYESYPREIAVIKDKWEKLQQEVYDKWQADKTELEIFKLK